MNHIFILFAMFFFHIFDDYYLQGILAQMKQKSWWINQKEYNSFYKYDYLVALIMHSFSWSFMVRLPISIYYYMNNINISVVYLILIIIQMIIHIIVDNAKANTKSINLVIDQSIHIAQIIISYSILV